MSTATSAQLETLRDAIQVRPPFCSGVRALKAEDFNLYFDKNGDAVKIDLAQAEESKLKLLSGACSPATFGVNQEDVLDESYRKAGKLDISNFATNFNPEHAGLIDVIRSELLDGDDGQRPVRFELYKLNVYGEGSFFKVHKDTPRSQDMFGSLEWAFDSAKERFSDVEHEVLKVSSGSRVTLTYNLYFDKRDSSKSPPSAKTQYRITAAFSSLLGDPAFLPDGGYLGFGLAHQYPTLGGADRRASSYLKGSDAIISAVARNLGLEASVKRIYDIDSDFGSGIQIITDGELDLDGQVEDDLLNHVDQDRDIVIGDVYNQDDINPEVVNWVTTTTDLNQIEQAYVRYGNEASLDYVYGNFCLIVCVDPANERSTVSAGGGELGRGR